MTILAEPAIEPVVRPKTTADVLRHAALLIEERGWHQDSSTYEQKDGCLCAVGALNMAATGKAWGSYRDPGEALSEAAQAILRERLGISDGWGHSATDGVEGWNDYGAQSAAEVIAALRAAAEASDVS